MPRELSQFENYLVHEFVEDYVDGIMSRRDMMRRVLHITGGVAATATVLTQLGVKSASAQEGTPAPPPTPTGPRSTVSVPEDDPAITASDITFPGAGWRAGHCLSSDALFGRRPVPGRPHLP